MDVHAIKYSGRLTGPTPSIAKTFADSPRTAPSERLKHTRCRIGIAHAKNRKKLSRRSVDTLQRSCAKLNCRLLPEPCPLGNFVLHHITRYVSDDVGYPHCVYFGQVNWPQRLRNTINPSFIRDNIVTLQ